MAHAGMQIDLNVLYGRWCMNFDVQIKYSSANYDACTSQNETQNHLNT